MNKLTDAQLNKLMTYASGGADEPEGEGWMTREEWTEELSRPGKNVGPKRFARMIRALIEENKAEAYDGTKLNTEGIPRKCVWYRIFWDKMED